MPRVSIIIPTYNRAQEIWRAIQSVLDQTYKNFELIIVDDGSTDDTRQVVEEFISASTGDSPNIYYLWQEHQERSTARNTGLAASRGEYISFLDSDDQYMPRKLELQTRFLDHNPELGMVLSGWVEVNDENGYETSIKPWLDHPCGEYRLINWLLSPPVHFCTTLVRRKWVIEGGGFDPEITVPEDVDLWYRMIEKGCRTDWVYACVLRHRPHVPDPDRYRLNYEKLLQKAYQSKSNGDLKDAVIDGITYEQAVGQLVLVTAYFALLRQSQEPALIDLQRAVRLNPEFGLHTDQRAIDLLVSGVRHPLTKDPIQYIDRLWECLPGEYQPIRRFRRYSYAMAWWENARRAKFHRQQKNLRTAISRMIYYKPGLIANRGVLAMAVEGFLGQGVLSGLRRIFRRTNVGETGCG